MAEKVKEEKKERKQIGFWFPGQSEVEEKQIIFSTPTFNRELSPVVKHARMIAESRGAMGCYAD